jgi:hypothetical protein
LRSLAPRKLARPALPRYDGSGTVRVSLSQALGSSMGPQMRGRFPKGAVRLLIACCALGTFVACSDLLGITNFSGADEDGGGPPTNDGSSSSGSRPESGSGGSSASGSTSGSSSGGNGSSSGANSSSSGSDAGPEDGPGSSDGPDSTGTPVIAFSGYVTSSAFRTLSSTLTWAQSAGDLIVLLINYDGSITQLSDTSGNVYAPFGTPSSNYYSHQTIYYCLDAKAAGAGANTVTITQSAPEAGIDFSVAVFGFSAPGHTWVQDQYVNNSQSSASFTTGSVTTVYASEVLVSGTAVDSSITQASGGSWVTEPLDAQGDAQEYLIVDSVQSVIAATYTQLVPGLAMSQLGTFAAKP